MNKVVQEHKTSDEKAYFIRNVTKINNPSEFFELIGKTGSTVKCTSDGMAINHNIDISPLAYNEIGSSVFYDKFNELKKISDLHKRVGENFASNVPAERQEEFKNALNELNDLPQEQRREATANLLREYAPNNPISEEDFNKAWTQAETDVSKGLNKVINDLAQGSAMNDKKGQIDNSIQKLEEINPDQMNEEQKKQLDALKDFKELKDLSEKKLNGTINSQEEVKLIEQVEKCSRHRKEYFFSSSKFTQDGRNSKWCV
jgi:hypothetical protein